MENNLPTVNSDLRQAFDAIASDDSNQKAVVVAIAKLVAENGFDTEKLNDVLAVHHIDRIQDIKLDMLDLIIVYITRAVDDHAITDEEKQNIAFLKLFFKIKEGDFYRYKRFDIEQILHRQFERLYLNNKIDKQESIYKFDLQDAFDLSYDEFDKFKENEILKALKMGADILDLDTARYPKIK